MTDDPSDSRLARGRCAKGGAGVGAVEVDPAVAARQGGAVGLSVDPGPQERLQVSGRQLLLGDGVAQLLVDAYRKRAGSGKDRRIALDEQIASGLALPALIPLPVLNTSAWRLQ